jgi:hypothetical protein
LKASNFVSVLKLTEGKKMKEALETKFRLSFFSNVSFISMNI